MNCPSCRHENPPWARRCPECGVTLTPTTPHGPASLEGEFMSLRQALPTSLQSRLLTSSEGENRLVTVLFTDMSRSLEAIRALHPEDAAGLVNRLITAMVDVLLKYQGRIDKLLGDGALAVFGVPQTHEDDPERAIRAALAIREAAGQLGVEVTAGINTGEVYVGSMGSERHQEVTVIGQVVHLASRFHNEAEPGQIVVGEATYRLTRQAFAFSPRTLSIKGLAQPVAAYVVMHALPKRGKSRGIEGIQAALIGRDEELAKLQAALDLVRCGRGQMVMIVGEAGVGKSRLVAELKEEIGERRVPGERAGARRSSVTLWLEGRCQELGVTVGYSLFVDLFHAYLASRTDEVAVPDPPPTPQRALLIALQELVEHGCLSAERAEEIGPVLGNLLSLRFDDDRDERLQRASPEQIRHQTFAAVQGFLVALSKRQPVALICEDLHWVDSQSLELISHLIESVTSSPLLLICVYRHEEQQLCGRLEARAADTLADRCTEIRLRELTPAESRRLVESLLPGNALPPDVWKLILEKTHGNPLFLEEMVRALIDSGLIYRDANRWRARESGTGDAGGEPPVVPETIQSVILSRVDRLDRELRDVLQGASVIGRVFRPRVLEQLIQGQPRLRGSLAELERHGLVYQERGGAEEAYSFRHVLTQETVYNTILRRRRTALHQQVAEAIEALSLQRLDEFYDELARHYSLSGCLPKAAAYLLKAGQRALRLYANQEAVHDFESALRCLEQLPADQRDSQAERIAHEGLGDVLFRTGDHAGAEARFQMALDRTSAEDVRDFAALTAKLADAVHWQGEPERAISIARAGLAALGDDRANSEAVSLLEVIMRSCWTQYDEEAARRYADQLQAILPHVPYFDAVYMSYYGLAWVEIRARHFEAAESWLQEMERVCSEHQHENGLARCYHGLGDLWRARGSLQLASDWFAKSLAYCERTGDAHLLLEGHLERAHSLVCLGGDPDAIDQHIQRGMAIAREMAGTRAVSSLPPLCAILGDAYAARDNPEKAMLYFRQALEFGTHRAPPRVLGRLERLYLLQDRHEEFRAFCRDVQTREVSGLAPLKHWYLSPCARRTVYSGPTWEDAFAIPSLREEWQWIDPGGESSREILASEGLLVMRTPAIPGLPHVMAMAPRLLRGVSGDFAAETVLVGADERESHTAGLLLWTTPEEYLFFGKGDPLVYEVRLEVCRQGQRQTIGRGWLPGPDLHLRLERLGDQVKPLSSSDGQEWHCWDETCSFPEGDASVGFFVACPTASIPGCVARFKGFRLSLPEKP